MAIRPRWNDDLSSDPFSDPAYSVTSGAAGWTYNASTDRLENSTAAAVLANFTLLNSNNQSGIVEADFRYFYSSGSDNTSMALRAFGYWFITAEKISEKILAVIPEEVSPSDFLGTSNFLSAGPPDSFKYARRVTGDFTMKVVATPAGVDFYLDNILEFTKPYRIANGNVTAQHYRSGGGSGGTSFVSRLEVLSDASVPKTPPILIPGIAGALTTATGPIDIQVPESRLYLDLGAFAGRITAGGLTNVVYDPGGANVSMSEDTGISSLAGGADPTTGDYYLEAPVRGVSSDYRLVIKESFVTANSVSPSDSIDFDIVGGPSGQTGTVVEEDDLHCFVEKYTTSREGEDVLSPIFPPASLITMHNGNADGNDAFIIQGAAKDRVIGASSQNINNVTRLKFNSSASFPFIFDFDLGRIRRIRKLFFANLDPESNVKDLNSVDIYSKPTPFSGASLLQGTLEADNYRPPIITAGAGLNNDFEYFKVFQSGTPDELDIETRYIRLVFNSDNLSGTSSSSGFNLGRQIGFYESLFIDSINSSDDNAQFQFDSGGGFGAFPGVGVPQNGGTVRVTLPANIQHNGFSPNYYKIWFGADLTD